MSEFELSSRYENINQFKQYIQKNYVNLDFNQFLTSHYIEDIETNPDCIVDIISLLNLNVTSKMELNSRSLFKDYYCEELFNSNILRFNRWHKGVLDFTFLPDGHHYYINNCDSYCDLIHAFKLYSKGDMFSSKGIVNYLLDRPEIIQKEWENKIKNNLIVSGNGFGMVSNCNCCKTDSNSNCSGGLLASSMEANLSIPISGDFFNIVNDFLWEYSIFLYYQLMKHIWNYYNEEAACLDFDNLTKDLNLTRDYYYLKEFINWIYRHHKAVESLGDEEVLFSAEIITENEISLKDIDLRKDYTSPFIMNCFIKSVKKPVLKNREYHQEFIFKDNDTKKTIKGKLIGNLCSFDDWDKNQHVEIIGCYKDFCINYDNWEHYIDIFSIKHIEFIDDVASIPNRNQETPGYDDWKDAVKKRDKICQCCGFDKNLEVHHSFGYKEYPELATDINNGIVLCKHCHDKYHSIYGLKNINPRDLVEFIKKFGVK